MFISPGVAPGLAASALPAYSVAPDPIGYGGFGLVLAGVHRQLARPVAIKVLPASDDTGERRDFLREGRVLAGLNHPHIVSVYDCVTDGEHYFLVMERLALPLGSLIGAGLNLQQICALTLEASDGLGYAHKNGILHRDIKPGNLMLSREGLLKVADFGIAQQMARSVATSSVVIVGSLTYMAPEQLQRRPGMNLTSAVDLYALGMVMYELVTGDIPFGRDLSAAELIAHKLTTVPSPPAHVPPAIAEVMMRLLSLDPRGRFPSADEFAAALDEAATGEYGAGWQSAAALPSALLPTPEVHALPPTLPYGPEEALTRVATTNVLTPPVTQAAEATRQAVSDRLVEPRQTVESGDIVFEHLERGICIRYKSDGTLAALAPGHQDDSHPDVGRITGQIAFIRGERALWTMKPDGSSEQQWLDLAEYGVSDEIYDVRLSPGEEWMLFRQKNDLYVIRIGGTGNVMPLTDEGNVTGSICWSPDGKSITYTGQGTRLRTSTQSEKRTRFRFRTGAQRTEAQSEKWTGIFQIPFDSQSGNKRYRGREILQLGSGSLGNPEWSPDGRRLYVSYLQGDDHAYRNPSREQYPLPYHLDYWEGRTGKFSEMRLSLGRANGISGMRVSLDGMSVTFTYQNRLYVAQVSSGLAKPVAMQAAGPVFVWDTGSSRPYVNPGYGQTV